MANTAHPVHVFRAQSFRSTTCLRPSLQICQLHVSTPYNAAAAIAPRHRPSFHPPTVPPPLSLLPLSNLIRSYALTAFSSYNSVLTPSLRLLSWIASSSSPFVNPDRNPIIHFLLKKTFYAQYCAGETANEVCSTVQGLKSMGFQGVMLTYGKETVLARGEKIVSSPVEETARALDAEKDVQLWKQGTIQTVKMTGAGDFVALKFSGAGRHAMQQLAAESPCGEIVKLATTEICDLAKARGVRLLFDAEQDAIQRGIDRWTLDFQRKYNQENAIVYGTYQAYLRATPSVLAHHLDIARRDGFTLGVKLVRGAYMASDPRNIFWGSKEETDRIYDEITEALIKRKWNTTLQPERSAYTLPNVDLVLASHNDASIKKAMALSQEQATLGAGGIELAYGQLMGMADEVSCELVLAGKKNETAFEETDRCRNRPKAYKYVVWGSVGECLTYLVRRAEENRDAVLRARESKTALSQELRRRIWR